MAYVRGAKPSRIGDGLTTAIGGGGGGGPNYAESASDDRSTREVFLLSWAVGIWGGAEDEEPPLEHDVSWGAWKI